MPLQVTGGAPFSNAGVKSTSLGMIPLLSNEIIPLFMSSSEIGGGSFKASSSSFLRLGLNYPLTTRAVRFG